MIRKVRYCCETCENLVCVATTIGQLQHSEYLKPMFLDTFKWAIRPVFPEAVTINSYTMATRDLPDIYAQARGRGQHNSYTNTDCIYSIYIPSMFRCWNYSTKILPWLKQKQTTAPIVNNIRVIYRLEGRFVSL